MNKIPSWKLNENCEVLSKKAGPFSEIISKSLSYTHSLNESFLKDANVLLDKARLVGWYPFISEVYNTPENVSKYDYLSIVDKDEIIFEVLMLAKEIDILESLSGENLVNLKNDLSILQAML